MKTIFGLFAVCGSIMGFTETAFLFSAYYLLKNKSPKLVLLLLFGFIYFVSGFWTLLMFKIFSLILIGIMNFDKIVSKYNMLKKLNETLEQTLRLDELSNEEREDIQFFNDKFNYIDNKINTITTKTDDFYAHTIVAIEHVRIGIMNHVIYTKGIQPLSNLVNNVCYSVYTKVYNKLNENEKTKSYMDYFYSHYQGLYKIYEMYNEHNEIKTKIDDKTKNDFMEQMNSLMQNMNTMMMSMSEDIDDNTNLEDFNMLFNMIQPQSIINSNIDEEKMGESEDNITITSIDDSSDSDDDINSFLKEDKKEDIIDKILEETISENNNENNNKNDETIIQEDTQDDTPNILDNKEESEETKDDFTEEMQKVIETGELPNILSVMSNEMDKIKEDIIETVSDIEEGDIVRRRKKQESEKADANTDSSNDTIGKKRSGRKKKNA